MTKNRRLTKKQEMFCKLYATDRDYFGNGTQAYAEAYNIDLTQSGKKSSVRTNASRLLTYDHIIRRIDKLLELGGLSDNSVDKELLFLIKQNANFNVKLGAIREYNSLRKRIIHKEEVHVKSDVNLTSFLKELKDKSSEQLIAINQRMYGK
ncbi:MAG: hypothetical protein PHE21_00375 [Candidatus Dojkabacteria bacterium]|nr:hypothetical protein [Candidatus Dojkabacteria bacterium]